MVHGAVVGGGGGPATAAAAHVPTTAHGLGHARRDRAGALTETLTRLWVGTLLNIGKQCYLSILRMFLKGLFQTLLKNTMILEHPVSIKMAILSFFLSVLPAM